MGSWWPIFDLELFTPRLRLIALTDSTIPDLLEAIHGGVHPVGVETSSFPPTSLVGAELERFCVQAWWKARVNWKPDRWQLDLVVFEQNKPERPIGMQSIAAANFAGLRVVSTLSWLSRSRHRRGLGTEMRWGALAMAFDGLGASRVVSAAEPSNHASKGVSLACGYLPAGSETIDTDDGPLLLDRFEVTVDRWRQLDRPSVEITGLGPSQYEFFGVEAD